MALPFIVSELSIHNFDKTIELLKAEIQKHGATIFGIVDHRANALSVNLSLPPTTVIQFGNPKVGTPLIEDIRLFGLVLPLKLLIWEDDTKGVVVSYPNLFELAKMYELSPNLKGPIQLIMDNLAEIASSVSLK